MILCQHSPHFETSIIYHTIYFVFSNKILIHPVKIWLRIGSYKYQSLFVIRGDSLLPPFWWDQKNRGPVFELICSIQCKTLPSSKFVRAEHRSFTGDLDVVKWAKDSWAWRCTTINYHVKSPPPPPQNLFFFFNLYEKKNNKNINILCMF